MKTTTEQRVKTYNEEFSKTLKIEVYYTKGGMNYFSGGVTTRGFWVSVTPVEVEKKGGIVMESFGMFSGVGECILPTARFTPKAFEQAKEKAKEVTQKLIDYMAKKEGLTKKSITVPVKVVSVSSNTNSFGLHGVIIMDQKGNAFEIAANSLNKPAKDAILSATISGTGMLESIAGVSYEIPRKLEKAPAEVVAEVWKELA